VKEIGLQRIWEKQAFKPHQLKTSSGKVIHILHPGEWNNQNGPDFLNASIRIDGLLLFGAIEIHIKASDWYAHNHHKDPRYNQTVLHVVWDNNKECNLENGQALECLCLKQRVHGDQIQNHAEPNELSCATLIHLSDESAKSKQLSIALKKRFNLKTHLILHQHKHLHQDWWYTALWCILTAWMGKANRDACDSLIQNLHKNLLMRNHNPKVIMAYLFGQSGWLNNCEHTDEYTRQLQEQYNYLCIKYQLQPSDALPWNTKQVRPPAFPQIRMAQFAQWLGEKHADLSDVFAPKSTKIADWIQYFSSSPNNYWESHYSMGKPSASHKAYNGKEHAQKIILNGLIPFLYAFGLETNKPHLIEVAEELLHQLPPENNQITRILQPLNIKNTSAKISQSLIAQHKLYCSIKRCRDCEIGRHLLNLPFMAPIA
jgi:hypothetical protein